MTSWTSHTRRKPILYRDGYYQDLPLGTFEPAARPATVVSAYYEMKSKYPAAEYRAWIRAFLATVPCFLVFFAEEHMIPFLEEARGQHINRTRFIALPREEWRACKAFPADFWDSQAALDPERAIHSPDLYRVWYEKKEFVRRAIELNPFGSEQFVWTDAGAFRNPGLLTAVADRFPVAARIPTDRILMLNSVPFNAADDTIHNFSGTQIQFPRDKPRIHGACLAGGAKAWAWWCAAYDETVAKFRAAGLFIGKDQTLMASLVLENKEKVSLLDLRKAAPDPWWYLLLYLGCSPAAYGFLRSDEARKGPAQPYQFFPKN